MFRQLRILILLVIFLLLAASAYLGRLRATDWDAPLRVAVYPINGDSSAVAAEYLQRLSSDTFRPMETYLSEQGAAYGIAQPDLLDIELAPQVHALPPAPPADGNWLRVVLWSLELRYWACRHDPYRGPKPQVKLYVLYFDPALRSQLDHSLGLQKAMLGVINAFAARKMEGSNQVVMTHELLHTLGATDKYAPDSNLPLFPAGYAEPELEPRHPQRYAEIMGGRIPISQGEARIPRSLQHTRIGPATAAEINWMPAR